MNNKIIKLLCLSMAVVSISLFNGCKPEYERNVTESFVNSAAENFTDGNYQTLSDKAYEVIDNNKPSFSKAELTVVSYESYSDLDELGRCGVAIACIGKDLMPTEKRSSIGMVKPSGWHTVKYDFVDGKYLYNRCHLIGYQLSGENANEKNLITGTGYFNTVGMLPFEISSHHV